MTIKNLLKNILVVASTTVMATGCTSIMKKNEAQADADIKKTEEIYTKSDIKVPDSLVTQSKQVYLTNRSFKIEPVQQLPALFNKNIVYTASAQENTVQVIDNIGKMLGLEIRFSEEASAFLLKSTSASIQSLKSYHGTFAKILSQIVNKEGLYWSYQNNSLKIFQVETKMYALDAPISTFTLNDNISSTANSGTGSSDSTSSGNSAMNMNYNIKTMSPWDAAVSTIKNMLSKSGRLDTNPAEGYVTVTDNPDRQKAISEYVSKINEKTSKKIAIRIDVYDVQNTSGGTFGFNINAVTKAFGGKINWVSAAAATVGDALSPNGISFSNGGDGSDHSVILNALNKIGKTTQITGTTIYTISGQPSPVQNSIQTNYLKSVSTVTTDTGTTVSAEPGTINTGYNMMVTPRIESDNQVLVSLNLQISTLLGITNFSLGNSSGGTTINKDGVKVASNNQGQTIQLPQIHTKNFLENVILKSGQSVLIAGFQDGSTDIDTNSLGDPSIWALGGSKATKQQKSTTVIVVTPYLIS